MPDKEATSKPEGENATAKLPEFTRKGGDILVPEAPEASEPGRLDGAPEPATPVNQTSPTDGSEGGAEGER